VIMTTNATTVESVACERCLTLRRERDEARGELSTCRDQRKQLIQALTRTQGERSDAFQTAEMAQDEARRAWAEHRDLQVLLKGSEQETREALCTVSHLSQRLHEVQARVAELEHYAALAKALEVVRDFFIGGAGDGGAYTGDAD